MPADDNDQLFDDKAREAFFSEAEELIGLLEKSVTLLDATTRRSSSRSARVGVGEEAELINEVFRAVHTLKGIASIFGASLLAGLSHDLEDLLDDLRLGRVALSTEMLDVLFESVSLYARILECVRRKIPEPTSDVRAFLAKLARTVISESEKRRNNGGGGGGGSGGGGVIPTYRIPKHVFDVLTQYEEHRLQTNIDDGSSLYWLRARIPFTTIDSVLEELKLCVRPVGEIIAYLPAVNDEDTPPPSTAASTDSLVLEILVATRAPIEVLRDAALPFHATVTELERTTATTTTSTPIEKRIEKREDEEDDDQAIALPTPNLPSSPPSPSPAVTPSNKKAPVARTVRVDIRKLDDLLGVVGELASVRGILAKLEERTKSDSSPSMRALATDLERLRRTFDRSVTQVQSHVLDVRMVPLSQAFDRLGRVVRQASRGGGGDDNNATNNNNNKDKDVHLVVTGADTEIDKLLVEELADPLMHIVRNAVDHGIEDHEARAVARKPPSGTVAINAYQKGNHVVIDIEDDGRGIDPNVIGKTARDRGIITDAEMRAMSAKELLALVFRPGFSTKREATAISGRGVGMDVVKTSIAKLGGIVEISSNVGIGTRIAITLPITLAISSVLVVDVRGRRLCMPLASIEEATDFDESRVVRLDGGGRSKKPSQSIEVVTHRGATLPLARLGDLLELDQEDPPPPPSSSTTHSGGHLLIAKVADRRVAFAVDRLIGREDVVVKALGRTLAHVRGLVGAAELSGSGTANSRLGLVLDAASLIDEVLAARAAVC